MSADNPHNIHNDPHTEQLPADDVLPDHARDLLISRVIDGRTSANDWDRFRALALHDPEIWIELADTQRQHEALRCELSHAVGIADRVDLPGGPIDDSYTRQRLGVVGRWGGWALAAALLLAWSLGNPVLPASSDSTLPQTAGIPGAGLTGIGLEEAEPEQAFEQYLLAGQRSGRVVAEMPEQMVIETTPRSDGSIEVLYLRQVIERRVLDRAYRRVRDDAGNTIAVPVRYEPGGKHAF